MQYGQGSGQLAQPLWVSSSLMSREMPFGCCALLSLWQGLLDYDLRTIPDSEGFGETIEQWTRSRRKLDGILKDRSGANRFGQNSFAFQNLDHLAGAAIKIFWSGKDQIRVRLNHFLFLSHVDRH